MIAADYLVGSPFDNHPMDPSGGGSGESVGGSGETAGLVPQKTLASNTTPLSKQFDRWEGNSVQPPQGNDTTGLGLARRGRIPAARGGWRGRRGTPCRGPHPPAPCSRSRSCRRRRPRPPPRPHRTPAAASSSPRPGTPGGVGAGTISTTVSADAPFFGCFSSDGDVPFS